MKCTKSPLSLHAITIPSIEHPMHLGLSGEAQIGFRPGEQLAVCPSVGVALGLSQGMG